MLGGAEVRLVGICNICAVAKPVILVKVRFGFGWGLQQWYRSGAFRVSEGLETFELGSNAVQ